MAVNNPAVMTRRLSQSPTWSLPQLPRHSQRKRMRGDPPRHQLVVNLASDFRSTQYLLAIFLARVIIGRGQSPQPRLCLKITAAQKFDS
jgi:hypothetical protein